MRRSQVRDSSILFFKNALLSAVAVGCRRWTREPVHLRQQRGHNDTVNKSWSATSEGVGVELLYRLTYRNQVNYRDSCRWTYPADTRSRTRQLSVDAYAVFTHSMAINTRPHSAADGVYASRLRLVTLDCTGAPLQREIWLSLWET